MPDTGRILIADDEQTFLHSTADLLRREGYECACAADAAKALDLLRAREYDLLIADIKMPGNPKLELVRDLPEAAKGMPVILVTGYPSLHSAIDSVRLPVAAYLVKPVAFEELLDHVRHAVEQRRVYQAVSRTHDRLKGWTQDLANIEQTFGPVSGRLPHLSVSTFLDLTLRNMAGALSDLAHLTEAIALNENKTHVCHLLSCPRQAELVQAIREAIDTLEKTKNAFKSRDLAKLRQKLEDIIEKDPDRLLTNA